MTIHTLFENLWHNYVELNPEVEQIHQLFADRNHQVINDHIALRTFNLSQVGIPVVAKSFIDNGYYCAGNYNFKDKKLYAQHFQHEDTSLPKVFISELLVDQFSDSVQNIIYKMCKQIKVDNIHREDFCYSGRHWQVSSRDYYTLLKESEYAAWMSAFGYRPNHFTVLVNALTSHSSLDAVNQFLLNQGYKLNDAGGLIKGSPEVFLEQSSTLAGKSTVQFSDDKIDIPSCFYEFAYRYPQTDGSLYQGFVASSADKIFESTDTSE